MAWAILQDKYPTRLDVPHDEWDALVKQIEEREKMKAEGQVVKELGGLHCIGTERHEARRIDLAASRALRTARRSGQQPFLSVARRRPDADFRRRLGEERPATAGHEGRRSDRKPHGQSRRIEGAQKKVEERNFEIRKNLLEYDEVMDEQRKRVYGYRQRILDGGNCKQLIVDMIEGQIEHYLSTILDKNYGAETFAKWASSTLDGRARQAKEFAGLDFQRRRAVCQG